MSIRTFQPTDTPDTFYLRESATLADILLGVRTRWPTASLANITIEAEYIHTNCLDYDQYDSSDYTNYLKIQLQND